MRNTILFFLISLSAIMVKAQDDDFGSINTDRTGLSESSATLPHRFLQLEMGGNYAWEATRGQDRFQTITYNSLVARYGLFDGFELRLGYSFYQYFANQNGQKFDSGLQFDPLLLGFKTQICTQKGALPTASLEGMLNIPITSYNAATPTYVSPFVVLPMSWDLSSVFSTAVNLGVFWNGGNAQPQYFAASYNSFNLGKGFILFAEVYSFASVGFSGFSVGIDGGLIWQPSPDWQLDISASYGIYQVGNFIDTGLSYRLPYRGNKKAQRISS